MTGHSGGETQTNDGELALCDLVMKGGITSGVVYPKLISTLSAKYRFKSIGGTSAGAIAAAGCAAAEYARQTGVDDAARKRGFKRLEALPSELQKPIGKPPASMLFNLFQPSPALRSHFKVLVGTLNARDGVAALFGGIRLLIVQFLFLALVGLAIGVLLLSPVVTTVTPLVAWRAAGWALVIALAWVAWVIVLAVARRWMSGWLSLKRLLGLLVIGGFALSLGLLRLVGAAMTWVLPAMGVITVIAMLIGLALVVVLPALRFVATLLDGLHNNFYGVCSGRTAETLSGQVGLTDWLYGYFNDLAGIEDPKQPLCFGHLWGKVPDLEQVVAEEPDTPSQDRMVNLEVMTTAVSQQLCYSIPFRDNAAPFYYDEAEWRRLFPDEVVGWLIAAEDAEHKARNAKADPEVRIEYRNAAGVLLRRLPSNRYLPLVVAVRMSLSFPVLLSAVPLYALDRSLTKNIDETVRQRAHRSGAATFGYQATRVWFSDGGISSNMPLHFFDSSLPRHPTFAVNLKEPHPRYPIDRSLPVEKQEGRVFLATDNRQGQVRYWKEPRDEAPLGLYRFLMGIVATMQNWRDEIQFPYPGYRDRIVQISQLNDEGGLNLNMPDEHIEALSAAGKLAAEQFIARFHPDSVEKEKGGWENHQEIRVRTFLGVVERMALSTHKGLADGTWQQVIQRVRASNTYSSKEADLAVDCLVRLLDFSKAIKDSGASLEKEAPRPRATMRIAPRI